MPARLTAVVDKLIEFNTSGAQPFLQHACAVALTQGEPFVAEMVARYRTGRELVLQRLGAMAAMGSPGTSRTMKNTSVATAHITMTAPMPRRMR